MSLKVIKSDAWGLYVLTSYVVRPLGITTKFKEGDCVAVHHFVGSTDVGVGKDASCIRGHYLETWTTTGLFWFELEKTKPDLVFALIEFYTKYPNPKCRLRGKNAYLYFKEKLDHMMQDSEMKALLERIRMLKGESGVNSAD